MTEVNKEYQARVEHVALNVSNNVIEMDKLPESLLEAYANLSNDLLEDSEGKFAKAWAALPASAQKLLPQSDFHGFYIACAWFELSRVAQDIAGLAERGEQIDEKEYNGIFTQLADESLKECIKKLKKSRTDRALLNSLVAVIAGK